jgi:hypothetical protein
VGLRSNESPKGRPSKLVFSRRVRDSYRVVGI